MATKKKVIRKKPARRARRRNGDSSDAAWQKWIQAGSTKTPIELAREKFNARPRKAKKNPGPTRRTLKPGQSIALGKYSRAKLTRKNGKTFLEVS